MQEKWLAWFRQAPELTRAGNRKQPTRQDVLAWVSKAWESVSENIICEFFVICGITTAIDGSQNEKMFNHIPRVLAEEIEEDDSENESSELKEMTLTPLRTYS